MATKRASSKRTTSARHTTAAHNPAKSTSRYAAKSNGRKTTRRASTRKTTTRRRRSYRRNPSDVANAAIVAIGGAATLLIFNELVARVAPTITGTVKGLSKAAAGWAVGLWGRKYLGTWASVVQTALWLSAASDAIQEWVVPSLPAGLITSAATQQQVVGQQAVQNTTTGQTGTRYTLSSGDTFDVFDGSMAAASSYAN